MQQLYGQLTYLLWHGGREHDALTAGRQLLYNLHDILDKAHIQHAVGLIEHKERATREVEITHLEVTEQSAWCGNQHIGTHTHRAQLLIVAVTIVTTVNSHAAHIIQIVAKALHGLVDLLCQLAGWRHDDGVDGILGIVAIVEF